MSTGRDLLLDLGVAAGTTTVIGLLVGPQWPGWVVGALAALSLAVGVWVGSGPSLASWTLRPATYAGAALVALVVGGLAWALTGADNAVWWSVGVVAAIVVPSVRPRPTVSSSR